jgi:hypothetical protein
MVLYMQVYCFCFCDTRIAKSMDKSMDRHWGSLSCLEGSQELNMVQTQNQLRFQERGATEGKRRVRMERNPQWIETFSPF